MNPTLDSQGKRPKFPPGGLGREDRSTTSRPLVWGHRGASRAAHQNSPDAFRLAHEWGAAGVELDIRRTVDEELVVHHDADLSDGRLIVETPRAELPDYVPTLRWVLNLFGDRVVNIEVKSGREEPDFDPAYPVVEFLAAVLEDVDPDRRHIVTSFDRDVIERMRIRDPTRPTGLITADWDIADRMDALAAAGHVAIMIGSQQVNAEVMSAAEAARLFVGVWTVNDVAEMHRLADLGVDAIMTDVPDVALAEYRA